MISPDQTAIVFVGPMGAGKSSIGRKVARRLDVAFTDTDKAIAAEHGPIPQIFAEHGEAHFRALERAAVRDALSHGGVVALGGGAVLDADTRADLRAHRVVLLTVEPRVVRNRISGGNRPLLEAEDPVAEWSRIAEERAPLYDAVADATFDTSHGPLQAVVEDILAWLERADGQESA